MNNDITNSLKIDLLYPDHTAIFQKYSIKQVHIRHYNLPHSTCCEVITSNKEKIIIKLDSQYSAVDFFPKDPIILNTLDIDNNIFLINGEIESVHHLIPPEFVVRILKIETKENIRKNERFFVSLKCHINNDSGDNLNVKFCIIRNISLSGFKITSKDNYEINEIIYMSVIIDRLYGFVCKSKILRKNKLDNYFVYGLEIAEIAPNDRLVLNDFIKCLTE